MFLGMEYKERLQDDLKWERRFQNLVLQSNLTLRGSPEGSHRITEQGYQVSEYLQILG